jgi:outer membrane protein assembly factor BamB
LVGAYRNAAIGVEDNTFRCLTADWKEVWTRPIDFDPVGLSHHPSGIVGLTWDIRKRTGYLYRLDGDTGEVVWRRKLKGPGPLAPTVVGDHVCLECDRNAACFRVEDGKPAWSHPVGQMSYPAVAWPAESAFLVGQHDGTITCLDAREGKVRWARKLRGDNGIVCRSGERVFAARRGGVLHALDPGTGRVLGKADMKVWSSVVADGEQLFFQAAHDNDDGYRIG